MLAVHAVELAAQHLVHAVLCAPVGGHINSCRAKGSKAATFIIHSALLAFSCTARSDSSCSSGAPLTHNDDVWVVWALHLGRAAAAAATLSVGMAPGRQCTC
jgi:hypothetical protein